VKKAAFKYYDIIIYASRGSNSARALADALKCRRWRDDLPQRYLRRPAYFRGKPYPLVINWGSTITPEWGTIRDVHTKCVANGFWINPADAVARSINKLRCFNELAKEENLNTVKFTTDKERVAKWMKKGYEVFVRHTVTGQGGEGITIISGTDVIPDAPLYTRNFPKTHEFRVHVFNGQAIDFVEKKAKVDDLTNTPIVSSRHVRNHSNGWVFAHDSYSCNGDARTRLEEAGCRAINRLGLVSGCVDILAVLEPGDAPRALRNYAICEVNTGPGLENTETINAYAQAILKLYKEKGRHA